MTTQPRALAVLVAAALPLAAALGVALPSSAAAPDAAVARADTTPPTLTFTPPPKVGPSNYVVSAGASDSSGIFYFEWWVDGQFQDSDGSSLSLAGQPEGEHEVAVRVFDTVGNGSETITQAVVVDTSVPLQTSGVPTYVAAPPTISFATAQDVVTKVCSVTTPGGAPAPQPCQSPWHVGSLADGPYEAVVTVTDDVGNSRSVEHAFTVDSVAPLVGLVDGPVQGGTHPDPSVLFSFIAADPHLAGATCTFDSEPLECAPGSPIEITDLAPGPHTFTVAVSDLAGNTAGLSRSFTRQVPTSLTARAKDRTVRRGTPATLVATGLPAAARGKVVFKRGSTVLCSASVDDGRARCRTGRRLKPGVYDAKATYLGSSGYARSSDTFGFRVLR